MQSNRMPDSHILAEKDAILFFHPVQHAAILHIRMRPDPDRMYIPSKHRIHPH